MEIESTGTADKGNRLLMDYTKAGISIKCKKCDKPVLFCTHPDTPLDIIYKDMEQAPLMIAMALDGKIVKCEHCGAVSHGYISWDKMPTIFETYIEDAGFYHLPEVTTLREREDE